MATILYVDDEPAIGLILQDTLERMGHSAIGASNVPEALGALNRGDIDLIISDFKMPGLSGLEFLELLRDQGLEIPLIILTGYATIEQVLQTVTTAAPTRATVLLQGESGTGKELFARAIHDQSDRRDRPFVKLNCAALPEGLVESALFGHEKGAFTGAIKRVEGAFERAHGGTLLLDEITEMRLDLQSKLLRVLQEQEFERVGGTSTIEVDVRIIATTNRDMAQSVERGEFRRDLFYRLSVMPIRIPALRERPEDVPILAHHFAQRAASDLKRDITAIAPEAIALLQRYDWPGNVRELQHAVERAVILTPGTVLQAASFEPIRASVTGRRTPMAGLMSIAAADARPDDSLVLTSLNLEDAQAAIVERALRMTGGNKTRAAELLGVSDRTLRNKLSRQRGEAGEKS
jgi:DNA-binding NtrC family response regulator